MSDVRYICVSDLHFGAQNSLLTNIAPGSATADPLHPSPTLVAFVDCLASLIEANEDQTTKPMLILNGDILDFALASDEVAIGAFERFVQLAFVDRDFLSHVIHYVPGNHDHHLWETARERQYNNYLERHPPPSPLAAPWHGTAMFAAGDEGVRKARTVEADLLQTIIRRFGGLADVTVEVHYPNFGLRSETAGAIAFHHGHYIDAMYRLMSRLKADLFPSSPPGVTPWDWEAENFAWIDFFWSTLGRSGQWGTDVGVIYDMLQEERAVKAIAHNLTRAITQRGEPRWLPAFVRRRLVGVAVDVAADRVAKLERNVPSAKALSDAGQRGLNDYIEGPLARQLEQENPDSASHKVTFVFGHTHKPFEITSSFGGFDAPVGVYNTGGWVVETLQPDRQQGAGAVLIDEDLNVAAIRLYNQHPSAAEPGVSVRSAGQPSSNPFCDRLRRCVDPAAEPWSRLSQAVATAVPQRYATLRTVIDNGIKAVESPAPAARRSPSP